MSIALEKGTRGGCISEKAKIMVLPLISLPFDDFAKFPSAPLYQALFLRLQLALPPHTVPGRMLDRDLVALGLLTQAASQQEQLPPPLLMKLPATYH